MRKPPYFVKEPEDTGVFTLDFAGIVEGIQSATVTSDFHGGTPEETPWNLIVGPASVEGTLVHQRITGGRNGAVYLLTCRALSEGGVYIDRAKVLIMRNS
jgi:hypothetical protein